VASIFKSAAPMIGLGLACAACCAVPIASSIVWAVSLAGLGTVWLGWGVGLALLAALGLSAVLYRFLRTHAVSCTSTACRGGCKASCAVPARQS